MRPKFRKEVGLFWVVLIILGSFVLVIKNAHAGDYIEDGSYHTIVASINDPATGDPISTQSPTCAIMRNSDLKYYDWSDATFKTATSVTTLFTAMTYNATGGFYYKTVSMDNASLTIPVEYIAVVSNDDATYGFTAAENTTQGSLSNLVKIHR